MNTSCKKIVENEPAGSAIAKVVLPLLLVLTILPLFILSFYNHPCNEDFWETNIAIQKGFFAAQKWWFITWEGRYFANMLRSLNPMVFGAYWDYKLNTVVLLLLLLTATYWLSGKLFKGLGKNNKLGITAIFISSFIVIMPSIAEGIFWQSSIYATLTANIMTLFLLGCIISYYNSGHKKGYLIFSALLAIVIIGCYEINMVFIDLAILILTFYSVAKKKELFFPLTLLAVCIIFTLIEITAPGNSMRGVELHYSASHNLLFSLKRSFAWGAYLLSHWLPIAFFIFIVVFDLLFKSTIWNKETDSVFIVPPWLSLIACVAIPVIGPFILFWATGLKPPLRTMNIFCFYFIAGILYFSFSCLVRIKENKPDFSIPVYIKIPVYSILFLLFIFRTNNVTNAYKDIISGTASAYNAERNERDAYLRNFKGDSCVIDSIKDIPHSLYFKEIPKNINSLGINSVDENTNARRNEVLKIYRTALDDYYHKKYIGIKGW